jgi:hypothetical protein
VQVVLLLVLTTVAILLGRLRLSLLVNYCFTLYWVYIVNLDLFYVEGAMKLNSYTFLYFCFGLVVVLLAMISLFMHHE